MSSYSVAEVIGSGEVDMLKSIAAYIQETCDLPLSAIDEINLSPLPSSAAETTLMKNG
jgi:hypothetical protein